MTVRRIAFAVASGPPLVVGVPPEAHPFAAALFPDDQAADPGDDETFRVLRSDAGYEMIGGETTWSAEDLPSILVRLELSVAETLVCRSDLPGIHAGGAVLEGGGVLWAGVGGSGKSSLTAAFARRGAPVLGDDVVLLDGGGWVHPFRRLLKVEEPARTILGLPPPPAPLDALWPDAAFYHPTALGTRWAEPAAVQAVVLPTRRDGAPVRLTSVSASDALSRLLPGLVMRDRVDGEAFEAVAAALDGARCLELSFGETPAAVDAILRALG